MKKFNLNEFQSGVLGLTEDLRTVRYIGMNPDGGEYQKLVAVIDGEFIPHCFSLDGKYAKQKHRFDIVYLKSRHQELIDSYNPGDTWQARCHFSVASVWSSCIGEPKWYEDCDYRIHPNNEIIKKLVLKYLKRFSPEWHDLTKYPAPEWAKYRAQNDNGEVYDFKYEPYTSGKWRDRHATQVHYVTTAEKFGDWKHTLISIDELRSKQKPQQPTLPEGFAPYESFLKTKIGENELVQFVDKLGKISVPQIFSKAFIGKDIIGYKILETVTKPKQDQSTDANQFQYPIYKISKATGLVVKFTDLTVGVTVHQGVDEGDIVGVIGKVCEYFPAHNDDKVWDDWTSIEKPKTKIVHEWMYRLKGSNYFEFVAFSDSDNVFDESHVDRQKTGRSWEVPI